MKPDNLKTAWIVKGLSIFFIFAPLGNLMLSLRSLEHPLWFHPDVALLLFPQVVFKDQIWLSAIFVAGLLLWFPRKWSWSWAMLVLGIVTLNNFVEIIQGTGSSDFRFVSFVATLGIVLALYFLRFPYLERRDSLVPGRGKKHRRWPTQARVILADLQGGAQIETRLMNISHRGALIRAQEGTTLSRGMKRTLSLPEGPCAIEGEVMHVSAGGLGFRFLAGQKKQISDFVESVLKS